MIIGVGLMGSSIGMNLIRLQAAKEVVGVGRSVANLREALRRKAIHRSVDVQSARALLKTLSKNDLVILASPVRDRKSVV